MCGLSLSPQSLPRPLLFQASALWQTGTPSLPEARPQAIATPALGRITPISLPPLPELEADPGSYGAPAPLALVQAPSSPSLGLAAPPEEVSFWPLVRMELAELLLLAALNGLFALLAALLCRAPLGRTYDELWPLLVPVHLCLSWAFIMVPLALGGQTPMMGPQGLLLDTSQPERRLAFSVFHLVSVLLFPLSFLCMILTQQHRTLAEVLTGQEILTRSMNRIKQ